jgi:ATP-dependent exoDNAse (exonuclease V) beta subunit
VHVLARELPVLASPDPEQGPVGFVAGAIDLVYRDPATRQLVVVDFKTDRRASRERAHAYARQGAVYQRALRDALGLAELPRFELWWLHADRIEASGASSA